MAIFSTVPEPVVTPILEDDGLVPIVEPDAFTLSFLIEVDPAVDVPVDVEAEWSGNPSVLDAPRVTVRPTPSQAPYLSTLVFNSIKPSDLGDYSLSVVVSVSREGAIDSAPVDVSMTLAVGENNIIQPSGHVTLI